MERLDRFVDWKDQYINGVQICFINGSQISLAPFGAACESSTKPELNKSETKTLSRYNQHQTLFVTTSIKFFWCIASVEQSEQEKI